MSQSSHRNIFIIENTRVPVAVGHPIPSKDHTKEAAYFPWLTIGIDAQPHVSMAAILSDRQPGPYSIRAVLYSSLLSSEESASGYWPNELWVDGGGTWLSSDVQRLVQQLHITLRTTSSSAEHKGAAERLLSILEHRLWSTLPGYAAQQHEVTEIGQGILTFSELETCLAQFLQLFQDELYLQAGQTPLALDHKHDTVSPLDPRELAILLSERIPRRALKKGIFYKGLLYWHCDLAPLVGKEVHVFVPPIPSSPKKVEVFFQEHWVCAALLQNEGTRRRAFVSHLSHT